MYFPHLIFLSFCFYFTFRIKEFPMIMTEMVYLQELHLGGNCIPGLLVLLVKLSCLFFAHHFSLSLFFSPPEIPEKISVMQELIVVNFANNRCKLKIPASISKLPRLRKLYLRGTELDSPPPALLAMTNCKWFYLCYS